MKRALVTGISGQDGHYLTRLLLSKGYTVFGTVQSPASIVRFKRAFSEEQARSLHVECVSLSDSSNVMRIVKDSDPHEIYNLAAQSFVSLSFNNPEYTADINALGTLRLLEAMRILGLKDTRFYQAGSSEVFGKATETPQTEATPFNPCSPYAVSKQFAFWTVKNYRDSYQTFACNGILYNHESPLRGEHFVTKKITRSLVRIQQGIEQQFMLGNLDARRDWGHAQDYVYAQWLMLQQDIPDDYVVATGKQRSIREFVSAAAAVLGMDIVWEGHGMDEKGIDTRSGKCIIAVDPQLFRPSEVTGIVGDSRKARDVLGWTPRISFEDMIQEMIECDLENANMCQER